MLVGRLSPQEYEKAQYRDLGPVTMLRVAGLVVHGSRNETSHTLRMGDDSGRPLFSP